MLFEKLVTTSSKSKCFLDFFELKKVPNLLIYITSKVLQFLLTVLFSSGDVHNDSISFSYVILNVFMFYVCRYFLYLICFYL